MNLIKKVKDKFFNKKIEKPEIKNESTEEQKPKKELLKCCICGAPETQANLIIRGANNVYICDKCASTIQYQMNEVIKYHEEVNNSSDSLQITAIPTPREIKAYLDNYVVGQDVAKKKLAIGVYNHYKRIFQQEDSIDIVKSDILLLGETGSGKCVSDDTAISVIHNSVMISSITIREFINEYLKYDDPIINKDEKFTKTWPLKDFKIYTDNGFDSIIALHETIPYEEYIIKTRNGKELHCADNHILFKPYTGEVFVKSLNVGDLIRTDSGIDEITYIENTHRMKNMYDFELSENSNHRYYTNGILSHNTELVRSIAKMLDVPFTIVDANSFTQAGYVGEDVESIISRLYQASDKNIYKTERGIVMIDEIDKIAKKESGSSITRDVSGEGVQQALLKIIEGSKVKISPSGGRKHPEKEMIEIDTSNILFICAGAFVGIDRIIGKRLNTKSIGFNNNSQKKSVDKNNMLQYLTSEDICNYGFIPEFVGRIPIITYVNSLTKEDLKKILTEPKNAIVKQYKKIFAMEGIQLVFNNDALDCIVDRAILLKTGARALRSIMEEIMSDYMYDAPDCQKKKIVITKKIAQEAIEAKQPMLIEAKQ